MQDNKKNYTIEEIKELINKKINNEELEDDDVIYYEETQEISGAWAYDSSFSGWSNCNGRGSVR